MPFPADQVPLFLAVLDCGSFSAAARQLGRVPSAVSMAIAQLEAGLLVLVRVYTYAFNWCFDQVFGLPASAAGPAVKAGQAVQGVSA
jgi:hypothetical protein